MRDFVLHCVIVILATTITVSFVFLLDSLNLLPIIAIPCPCK